MRNAFGRAARAARFENLLRPHVRALYQAAFRYLRDPDDAEDLVQDVLAKLYGRVDELERIEALRPWLLRVLYRQCIDTLRKRGRAPETVADEEAMLGTVDPDADPARAVARDQTNRALAAVLAALTEEQRVLLDLHLVQGFTLPELAEVFGAPLGTLKARVHRLKAELRKRLLDATIAAD
ncbi:MAG: RNA polymerase sigma factor [Pseudomonadales bacterium]|nr:RNA polymerase sigma factor [Pseudomonadales bacterium]